MPTTAELMRKENDTLRKAQSQHRARIQKLEASELKRISKILKQTGYFEYDFSDDEVIDCIKKMILVKNSSANFAETKKETTHNNSNDSNLVVTTN